MCGVKLNLLKFSLVPSALGLLEAKIQFSTKAGQVQDRKNLVNNITNSEETWKDGAS